MSARERATVSGFAIIGAGRTRGIGGTTSAGSVATGRGFTEKIGAGCGPGWR